MNTVYPRNVPVKSTETIDGSAIDCIILFGENARPPSVG